MSESRLLAPPGTGRFGAVLYALRTTNPPPDRAVGSLDGLTRWVVVTRAAVLPMTLFAGLVAGLLAVRAPGFSAWMLALAVLGILLAHTGNNLMNDLSDTDVGLDTEAYPRALYAPHPILSGLVTRRQLLGAIAACTAADFVIMVVLALQRGWAVVAFAVGGFALSYAYTAPPLRLKKRGLGEPDVFVTWGPLMVAGTYFSATGHLPWQVWVASVPYGVLCTTVLMGKHIDKIPYDAPTGTRTIPVILGEPRARVATIALVLGFYVAVAAAVLVGALPWPSLVVLAYLPTARKVDERPARRQAGRATEGLPGLAAVVRRDLLRAHLPRRCAAGARPAAVRGPGDRTAAVSDLLLALLALTGLVVVLCLLGLGLLVAPFVLAVDLAERRGFASVRSGVVAATGPAVGLLLAYAVHSADLSRVLYLPAALLCWAVPGALALLAPGLRGGGRQGLHER